MKKAIWGKLQSLTDGIPSISLSEDETVVGRKDVGGTNMNISSRHFKIIRRKMDSEKEEGGGGSGEATERTTYELVNTSTNGTYVNKREAVRNEITPIQDGYDISMLDPVKHSALAIKYIFLVLAEEEAEKRQNGPQDRYAFGELLGTGHFAVVRRVRDSEGNAYAMKVIDKSKVVSSTRRATTIMDEAAILRKISHPNIVTINDVFETNKKVYIIMEL